MSGAVIENPILNSPFDPPTRHWAFDDEGITDQIVEGRRESKYFAPIPAAKRRRAAQQELHFQEWTADRYKPTPRVNGLRADIEAWRLQGWPGVTSTTRSLLAHWIDPERNRRLYFCQLEALETAIWLLEVAPKTGRGKAVLNELQALSDDANPGLFRIAHKMATGTGKTVVMAMLIAWHTLNKAANPQDRRFADAFLVVAPGITIRDRLRVLLPSDPNSYYRQMDLVPNHLRERLGRAQIVITNFHTFKLREKTPLKKATKEILGVDEAGAFTETPDQMVRRVCRGGLGQKKNIVVLNDEAHHCYRHRVGAEVDEPKLKGDERAEAQEREQEARVWISGLEAVQHKIGVRAVYDLSATPFFLNGSGYREGTLFPWVVSDFGLIDAIEAGLVKIPRVPVDDDALNKDGLPTYRTLWLRVRDALPKKGRSKSKVLDPEQLPGELQGAIHSLYVNYEKAYRRWEEQKAKTPEDDSTPPVFIVVCNNTNVSKLVFDYIAGYEKDGPDGEPVLQPGALQLFSNVDRDRWRDRPLTILVDSKELDSGEAMTNEFKVAAGREIDEFKREYRERYPGADADALTDEDLLREVMNTVGKPGRLGGHVRCVVSVSMLTEGWDANTVTHILGVRAFGTQLLCEQVVGRGLRRRSHAVDESGRFSPEYAEVYGVPFAFIPTSGAGGDPPPQKPITHVRSLPERPGARLTFPRLDGYRWELPDSIVFEGFDERAHLTLTPADVPTTTEVAGIVGEVEVHRLDDLKAARLQTVAFTLAKQLLKRYFRSDTPTAADEDTKPGVYGERPWLFPTLVRISRRWLDECLETKGNAFSQLVLLHQYRSDAVDRIYHSILRAQPGEKRLLPVMKPYDPVGSTDGVDFDTSKPVRPTSERSPVSHTVADSAWEFAVEDALEAETFVLRYVKNQGLGFTIPYSIDGEPHDYVPDFLADLDDGRGVDDPLHVVIEVSGQADRSKAARVDAARTLWVPAVNGVRRFGRWTFIEVTDPYEAADLLRAAVADATPAGAP